MERNTKEHTVETKEAAAVKAGKGTPKDKPCHGYLRTGHCADGRDHCYDCARHLDGAACSKGCK